MVSRNYFSHTTPTGEAFDTRILASGYARPSQGYELGENIDCATLYLATPAATVSGLDELSRSPRKHPQR